MPSEHPLGTLAAALNRPYVATSLPVQFCKWPQGPGTLRAETSRRQVLTGHIAFLSPEASAVQLLYQISTLRSLRILPSCTWLLSFNCTGPVIPSIPRLCHHRVPPRLAPCAGTLLPPLLFPVASQSGVPCPHLVTTLAGQSLWSLCHTCDQTGRTDLCLSRWALSAALLRGRSHEDEARPAAPTALPALLAAAQTRLFCPGHGSGGRSRGRPRHAATGARPRRRRAYVERPQEEQRGLQPDGEDQPEDGGRDEGPDAVGLGQRDDDGQGDEQGCPQQP